MIKNNFNYKQCEFSVFLSSYAVNNFNNNIKNKLNYNKSKIIPYSQKIRVGKVKQ